MSPFTVLKCYFVCSDCTGNMWLLLIPANLLILQLMGKSVLRLKVDVAHSNKHILPAHLPQFLFQWPKQSVTIKLPFSFEVKFNSKSTLHINHIHNGLCEHFSSSFLYRKGLILFELTWYIILHRNFKNI